MEINACDMGINPVKNPVKKRRIKTSHTELAKLIRNIEIPKPIAKIIRIVFLPNLSPIFPHMGENKKAATKVTEKQSPDQCCTNSDEY